MDVMPKSTFEKKLWGSILITLLIIVPLVVVLVLVRGDIVKRIQRVDEYKSDLLTRSQAIGLLAELKKNAQRAEPLLERIENRLPTRDELILFPRELERIALEKEVDFGFTFGNETTGSEQSPGVVTFTMSLAGTYDALTAFLQAIESSRYYIRMESVDLTRKDGGVYALVTSGEVYIRNINGNEE